MPVQTLRKNLKRYVTAEEDTFRINTNSPSTWHRSRLLHVSTNPCLLMYLVHHTKITNVYSVMKDTRKMNDSISQTLSLVGED